MWHRGRRAGLPARRPVLRQAGKPTDGQAGRQARRPAGWHAGRSACKADCPQDILHGGGNLFISRPKRHYLGRLTLGFLPCMLGGPWTGRRAGRREANTKTAVGTLAAWKSHHRWRTTLATPYPREFKLIPLKKPPGGENSHFHIR